MFQALEAGLGREGLLTAHVRSHAGDPYNELVDWLAKREPHQSQLLPRQQVNMQSFTSILRHLWMAVASTADLPHLHKNGFDVSPCALPLQTTPKAPETAIAQVRTRYTISCGQRTSEPFIQENKVILASFHMSENNSVYLVFIFLDFKKLEPIQAPPFKTRSTVWPVDMKEGT